MAPLENALVVGADSFIGSGVIEALRKRNLSFLATSRRPGSAHLPLDLAQPLDSWEPPARFASAFLCAAFCNIAACEKEPELARRINVDGPAALARALTREGAFVVFPSTSLVFDGLFPFSPPDAPVRPATLYARLKAEAERELLALGAVSVVRLSKVIGPATALFAGWVSELRAGKPVFPFDDMMMAPISGTLAVEVMLRAAERRAQGVLHLSARRDVSYAEAARHIAERLGAPPSLVQPRSRLAAGIPDAAAPRHTALDCRRTARELDLPPPDPFDALEEFLQEEPWKTTAPATR